MNDLENSKEIVSLLDDFENEQKRKKLLEEADEKRKIEEDYNYSKNTLHELLDHSKDVLDGARDVALETLEPRAVEAYNNLLKTMAKVATDVMKNSVEKSKAEVNRKSIQTNYNPDSKSLIDENKVDNNPPQIQQPQAIFVGSTTDLLKLVQEESRKLAEQRDVIDNE